MFNERQPTTQLTSPQVWHEYAKVLYGQPPPLMPHAHVNPLSNLDMVRNTINWSQYGKVQ